MKRRNADCGKIRRPIKRNKITEGMYGSTTVLYLKFLILWAIVITADFMFMFRFEFLWPFWLLLRSAHDSFKYKGLAFSVLFVCIAITSDLICLFFIPVHWLLFAASTYVWVQYVWHTDKGICLPTIILWMLFVYLEAGIRWKDSRHMPHLDLCRPFAAHCIGYPVVTLGFGFKSYVGYRMRQRKQRDVAKENEFYMQLLQQALPQEENLPSCVDDNNSTTTSSSTQNGGILHSNGQIGTSLQTQVSVENNNSSNNHNQTNSTDPHIASGISILSSSSASSISNHSHHNNHQHNNSLSTITNTASTHSNLNISTNSSSNNKNAQTNSKLNNNLSNNTTILPMTSSVNNNNNNSLKNNHRRSIDKATKYETTHHNNNSNNIQQQQQMSSKQNQNYHEISKNSSNWDSNVEALNGSQGKENNKLLANTNNYNVSANNDVKRASANGSILQYELEEMSEPVEKVKGRRNRFKKDALSKDNHNNNSNHSSSHNQHHHHHHSKDSGNSDTSSVSSSSSTNNNNYINNTTTISNFASQLVKKICETCARLEAEVKKYRSELSHMKQIENELRQKLDSQATIKSCLQAKQKEYDELDKRLTELQNSRQVDLINLQQSERRLVEERRMRQSFESQLQNEKKSRKLAEDKMQAIRSECTNEQCKQRKQQIEIELKQLRRELKALEDAKQSAEQQSRKLEQELRIFEAEIRNREAHQGTEVLMSALQAMQDKNSTLEKNLSAETRVKLDLFSALGEAKRQLEIKDNILRNTDNELMDLRAKIAQLLAVMPTDSLCLSPQGGSSILRINETSSIPSGGPASPMLTSLTGNFAGGGPTAAVAAQANNNCVNNCISQNNNLGNGQQLQQQNINGQQQTQQSNSCLDPNATAYTPKLNNNSLCTNGSEA